MPREMHRCAMVLRVIASGFLILVAPAWTFAAEKPKEWARYERPDSGAPNVLHLYADGTFLYESGGPSCWVWYNLPGTWKWSIGGVEIAYSVEGPKVPWEPPVEDVNPDPHRVCVFVVDTEDHPINGIETRVDDSRTVLTAGDGSACFDRVATESGYAGVETVHLSTTSESMGYKVQDQAASRFRIRFDTKHETVREDHGCQLRFDGNALSLPPDSDCPNLAVGAYRESPASAGRPSGSHRSQPQPSDIP